jgi:hypothetical protein
MPNAFFESGQALEKAQNGDGWLFEKVGMDLGLAPCRLGVGATSAWGWRHLGLAEPAQATSRRLRAAPHPGRRPSEALGPPLAPAPRAVVCASPAPFS